jgi:hypothetical protein
MARRVAAILAAHIATHFLSALSAQSGRPLLRRLVFAQRRDGSAPATMFRMVVGRPASERILRESSTLQASRGISGFLRR